MKYEDYFAGHPFPFTILLGCRAANTKSLDSSQPTKYRSPIAALWCAIVEIDQEFGNRLRRLLLLLPTARWHTPCLTSLTGTLSSRSFAQRPRTRQVDHFRVSGYTCTAYRCLHIADCCTLDFCRRLRALTALPLCPINWNPGARKPCSCGFQSLMTALFAVCRQS